MNPKQRAAEAALAFVADGTTIGLGTGSTADFFLKALGAALASGAIKGVRGVPTSRQSERRARELGIPLTDLAENQLLDVTIDGADEIDPALHLIKGLGGALLGEKIVAQNSRKLVIIADSGKTVERLGTRSPLPVEVVPFGQETQHGFLTDLGATPTLRVTPSGEPFLTDNGNHIYDCRFPDGIEHPEALESKLLLRAGVVESGLFLNIARVVLIADEAKVERRER